MSIPFSVLQDYLDLISPEALPQIPQRTHKKSPTPPTQDTKKHRPERRC